MLTLDCLRCGGCWKPRVEQPKRCPKCGSLKWNSAKAIKAVTVYGKEDLRYRKYHYHVETTPSIPNRVFFSLLLRTLKNTLEACKYVVLVEGDTFQVRKMQPSGYSDRMFKFSGKDRIHIIEVTPEGKNILLEGIARCFDIPIANIDWQEMSDEELESLAQRRKFSIHCETF